MMQTIRRQVAPAVLLLIAFAVLCGIAYPALTWAVGTVAFGHKVEGSFATRHGQVIGSSLIGQSFSDASGNALVQYFQPRPSSAGTGYNALSSSPSSLGPSDPRVVGFVPGLNTVSIAGAASAVNPFASKADPTCVPMDKASGSAVISPTTGEKFQKNKDGSYVCDTNTVPERAMAYRVLNGLSATVPIDAVTASGSGLDPDISPANAELQAARVAKARHLSLQAVMTVVHAHVAGRQWGFLGEDTVNVLNLNLALDRLR